MKNNKGRKHGPKFVGQSLNWEGSIPASAGPYDILYTVHFIPVDESNGTNQTVKVTLYSGDDQDDVGRKLRNAFGISHPHKPTGTKGAVEFNVEDHHIMHSIRGGNLNGLTPISYSPVKVVTGLEVSVSLS